MIGGGHVPFLALILSFWVITTSTASVDFQNCLSENTLYNQPQALQLVPQFVDVIFDTTSQIQKLNVTVWANVTGSTAGSAQRLLLPSANNTEYWNGSGTEFGGKIEANPAPDTVNKETTLYNRIDFMTYQPIREYLSFCDNLTNGKCPLGPTWSTTKDALNSSFALRSLAVTLKVNYGNREASEIGCISVIITPEIDSTLAGMIMYMPVLVLVSVGIAICLGAILSPWGSFNAFHWVTNYGHDPDLLRLVTPTLGDCLQYIQFIFLTSGLTINYPGFYQPIVSKLGWSALISNRGLFKGAISPQGVSDGIYVAHGHYGLERLSKLIGIAEVKNIFGSMAFWLFIIIVSSSGVIQIGFFIKWANRQLHHAHEEDLREKNIPFSVGNIIRIVLNYFLLPIVTLSIFQLAIASKTPIYTVVLAVFLLLFIIGITLRLLGFIISARPKSLLFEDHRIVLLYGSLYNTYSDHAISYALLPIILTLARGIAIGALQISGIFQLFLLATCEVITILSIYGFRPYHSLTSMNGYQISFSAFRLATIILMISFAPFMNVPEGTKGWIGYSILFMHCIVLIMGFLLNAIQTIMEVGFGLIVAVVEGGKSRNGLVHALSMRQLSRNRVPNCDIISKQSSKSDVIISDIDERNLSIPKNGRARSESACSTHFLLPIQSAEFDFFSGDKNELNQNQTVTSFQNPLLQSNASMGSIARSALLSSGNPSRTSLVASNVLKKTDPYYRPPRFHRSKLGRLNSSSKYVKSRLSEQWSARDPIKNAYEQIDETSLKSRRNSSYISFLNTDETKGQSKADYTTREADLYYKIRGSSPFSNISNEWSRNGSSLTIGPTKSAASWVKWIFGSKKKKKREGFEVLGRPRKPPSARFRTHPSVEIFPERTLEMSRETDDGSSGFDDSIDSSAILESPLSYTNKNDNLDGSTESKDIIPENNNPVMKIPPSTLGLDFFEYGLPDDDLELLSGSILLPSWL